MSTTAARCITARRFRELHLIPGQPGYNERLRSSIFLTSKTALRFGKGGWQKQGLINVTNGAAGSHTVDDVRRTLSQVFGDGQGSYPQGAYLNMVLMHSIMTTADVDALYEGYNKPDPKAETIGALATLIDYRDGTNFTGLNPKGEKLIRHIGFSGHQAPDVMMDMIQRDSRGILEGMLVAINANDRQNFTMQYNVIPVAAANNMGVIAMKVFADGAMYTKEATWTSTSGHGGPQSGEQHSAQPPAGRVRLDHTRHSHRHHRNRAHRRGSGSLPAAAESPRRADRAQCAQRLRPAGDRKNGRHGQGRQNELLPGRGAAARRSAQCRQRSRKCAARSGWPN